MPEEKKKESFTFSDKIKNSKTVSKSFAGRVPSKIGSDGKPRQTLFERTKRDAPFFVAALVALLLLPFLYKYSGHVEDDVPMITPGYEDSMVNPDRSGFDFSADPEGQISQLSGRDSMDLIVGFGKRRSEEESDDSLADFYRNGMSDSSTASAASYRRSDMDEEENTTNIYKYRKQAAPQTRAAFRRAATSIGNLKPGGMNRSGGGLRVMPWGGGLKSAANRVRNAGPRNSTKPVSLQPLQAAGKPSRSYFGQGAAAEARRSKDAMSKGNAMQALMDAQMKPVEPGRVGGVMGGDFGGPGGGNGNLHREFAFNGKEPWWWDLMKTREQMRWQKIFEYQWGWVDWATKIVQNLFGKLLSCWITGTDDWSVDHWFGGNAGDGGKKECCGLNADKFHAVSGLEGKPFDKINCEQNIGLIEDRRKKECDTKWVDTTGVSGLTRRQKKLDCFGGLNARLTEVSACRDLKRNYMYQVDKHGIAKSRNWNVYHYVVARNYVPEVSKELIQVAQLQNGELKENQKATYNYLCTEDSDSFQIGAERDHGVGASGRPEAFTKANANAEKGKEKANDSKYDKVARSQRDWKENQGLADMRQLNPEEEQHACVIYVARGDTFNYKLFQESIVRDYEELLHKQNPDWDSETLKAQARKAFTQLDLMFVDSVATKDALGRFDERDFRAPLPMVYWRFYDTYIRHKGSTTRKVGGKDNVDNRKLREKWVDYVEPDEECWFDDTVAINCEDAENVAEAKATVTFKQGYKGQGKGLEADPKAVTVTAEYTPLAKGSVLGKVEQKMVEPQKVEGYPNVSAYYFKHVIKKEEARATRQELPKDEAGRILWTLYRNGRVVGAVQCELNMSGDGGTSSRVEDVTCKTIDDSAECCARYGGSTRKWDGKKCALKSGEEQQQQSNNSGNSQTNGSGNSQASNKSNRSQDSSVRLASRLTWIPKDVTSRNLVERDRETDERDFTGKRLIDGKDEEHCADDMGIEIIETPTATKFVNDVIAEYNRRNPNTPMALTTEYPRMAEFVDALNIAKAYGIEKVPMDGVCLMARHVVRRSADPHSTTLRWGNNEKFYNELGAYLAYVHEDSVYYPAKYYQERGNCDKRFMAIQEGECVPNGELGSNRKWNFTNYGWAGKTKSYTDSLNDKKVGIGTSYPLAALAQGQKVLPAKCKKACTKERETYDRMFKHLLRGQCPTGDMEVEKALSYIKDGVCKNGLYTKPWGSPGNKDGTVPAGDINSGNTQVVGQ